ncbi:tachykinin-like peptides receptor 86C [Tetranychus urticae]|uniref:G-protein coupled receptors family 1 profile domain-containing protein n=1 Tax=Tetranychus urticae TaxID=32264 RepID=T1K8Z9_TETUR|nr:tachykinin-like peptides receptor 86C [Tetranychus urticae]
MMKESSSGSRIYNLVDFYNQSDPLFWSNVTECVTSASDLTNGLIDSQSYSDTSTRIPVVPSLGPGWTNSDSYLYPNQSQPGATNSSINLSTSRLLVECLKLRIGSAPYILVPWARVIWILLFTGIITVTVIGNALVIWIILAHIRMRTITNLFLLNLALADLLMALFNTAFNFTWMLNSHWPFGSVYCSINNFIAHLTVFSSVFILTVMSIDRYIAIVRPLSSRMSRRTTLITLNLIWIIGAIISLPNLLFSMTVTYIYPDGSLRTVCLLKWPDGFAGYSSFDYIYNILFLVITYFVPVITMAATYPQMISVLWGSQNIGEITERLKSAIKAKRKIVRMLISVVFIFVICWLPYHIYFLIVFHFPKISHYKNIQNIYLAIYWLAMSNSIYNPVIYYKMNGRFRRYFQSILCFCRSTQKDPGDSKWNNLSMHRRVAGKRFYPNNMNNTGANVNHSTRSTRSNTCRSLTNGSVDVARMTEINSNCNP